jgi:hypothetical protein
MVHFHFQFFQKRQNKIKKDMFTKFTKGKATRCLLQSLAGSNSDHTSPFVGFWSPKASTPFNLLLLHHQEDSDKSPRKGASTTGWKIRVE